MYHHRLLNTSYIYNYIYIIIYILYIYIQLCRIQAILYTSSHGAWLVGYVGLPNFWKILQQNKIVSQAGRRSVSWHFGPKIGRFSETSTKNDQTCVVLQHSSRLDYLHTCRGSMGESLYARDPVGLWLQEFGPWLGVATFTLWLWLT